MVPVAIIGGIALSEAALAALNAAVLAASSMVLGNALNEKLKDVEKERANAPASVPSAKTHCPYDKKVNDINQELSKTKKEYDEVNQQGAKIDEELQELRKRDADLKKGIEDEARENAEWRQSDMEKSSRESWKSAERDRIKKRRDELIDQKGDVVEKSSKLKAKGQVLLKQRQGVKDAKARNQAKPQEQIRQKEQPKRGETESNMHRIERNPDGSLKDVKKLY